jgi:hypothetical protein
MEHECGLCPSKPRRIVLDILSGCNAGIFSGKRIDLVLVLQSAGTVYRKT